MIRTFAVLLVLLGCSTPAHPDARCTAICESTIASATLKAACGCPTREAKRGGTHRPKGVRRG